MERLGRWCARRRWWVVAGWLVALVGLLAANRSAGGDTSLVFEVPGAESQRALDLLQERFPERAGDTADVVVRASAGITAAPTRARLESLFAEIRGLDHVVDVTSPYGAGEQRVSRDGTIAYATIQFDDQATNLREEPALDALKDAAKSASSDGLQVELGGRVIQFSAVEGPGGRSEGVGLLVAVLVLMMSFGSLVAMGLPIATSLFGLGAGLSALGLLANVMMDLSDFGPRLAALIGLGVGIDYALFIVTRYRQELHAGRTPTDAIATAMGTAGKAVLFAGATVIISLSGMLAMGVPVVRALAIGSGVAVLTVLAASLTLTPAVLAIAGRHIDRLRVPSFHRDESQHRATWWFRWSRLVQRRPLSFALAGTIALITLAVPVLSMRLGSADAGKDSQSTTQRRAYDLLAEGFGAGFNGPLLLVAELPDAAALAALDEIGQQLSALNGVAAVAPARVNPAGDTAIVTVFPTTGPDAPETQRLLDQLRDSVIPPLTADSGIRVSVGGVTALFDDLGNALARRLPIFITVVIGLSFVLLMAVFRSVVIPLKAAVLNLLSIGAAYGVIVAVFQWGWGKDLIGLDETGPIQSFIPMLLFAVLFGLSMDYEVFLLSRIREEYLITGDNGTAVADGLAATARVITAAALIMVAVFGAAVLAQDRTTKLFGLGLATAVFVDATLIRTIVVPATMELLGGWNWWMPKWLARVVPHIHIETSAERAPAPIAVHAE